jgi:hypothetical protein
LHVRYYPVHVSPSGPISLDFRLPFGETSEGGTNDEALVSGTLKNVKGPVAFAQICLTNTSRDAPKICVSTNALGEYAAHMPVGTYDVEVKDSRAELKPVFSSARNADPLVRLRLDLRAGGTYLDKIQIREDGK